MDRVWRLAVEEERNRIARDIHDTVAQSLFGIVFTRATICQRGNDPQPCQAHSQQAAAAQPRPSGVGVRPGGPVGAAGVAGDARGVHATWNLPTVNHH